MVFVFRYIEYPHQEDVRPTIIHIGILDKEALCFLAVLFLFMRLNSKYSIPIHTGAVNGAARAKER